MAENDCRCVICDRKITPKNSPSQFDVYGKWEKAGKYAPICDECLDSKHKK